MHARTQGGGTAAVAAALALLTAVALGVAWWLLRPAPDPEAGNPVVEAPSAAPDLATVFPEGPEATSSATPVELAAPPAASTPSAGQPAVVHGRVTREVDGLPVQGVTIVVRGESEDDGRDLEVAALSGADGRYRIELPAAAHLRRVSARPGPATIAAQEAVDVLLEAGDEFAVDVEVGGGLVLAGRVEDGTGVPVGGAEVRAWLFDNDYYGPTSSRPPDRSVRTDGAGRFELAALGPAFIVGAVAEGRVVRLRLQGTGRTGRRDLDAAFELVPARRVDVRCEDVAGRPVAVRLEAARKPDWLPPAQEVTVDPDLHWSVPEHLWVEVGADGRGQVGPLTDTTWELRIEDERFPRWLAVHAPDDDPQLRIVLGEGVRVHGLVTDGVGVPLAGATILFDTTRGVRETTSGPDGRFELDGLDAGSVRYLAWAPGHALERGAVWDVSEPARIRLPRAGDLHVRVLGAGDAPLEGAVVAPSIHRTTLERFGDLLPLDRHTDADGRVHLDWFAAGAHDVDVAHRPTRIGATHTLSTGPDEQVIRLVPPADVALSGRVLEAATGAPVQHFSIAWRTRGPGSTAVDRASFTDGVWEWSLPDVLSRLTFEAEEHAPVILEDVLIGELPQPLDVLLHAARSLDVRLRDPDGQPVVGLVTFTNESGRRLLVEQGEYNWRASVLADESGRVRAVDLPAALVEVRAESRALGSEASSWVDLSTPRDAPLELVLLPGATRPLTLVVFEGDGSLGWSSRLGSPWTLHSEADPRAARPVEREVSVEVRRDDGEVVLGCLLSAAEAGAADAWGLGGGRFVTLDVPAEPLQVVVDAPGLAPVVARWEPAGSGAEYDHQALLVVLAPPGD